MSNCYQYQKFMQMKLDGDLNELDAKRLRKHLESCPSCAEEYQELQELNDLLEGIGLEEPPSALKDGVMAQILNEEVEKETVENKISSEKVEKEGAKRIRLLSWPLILFSLVSINTLLFIRKFITTFNIMDTSLQERMGFRFFFKTINIIAIVSDKVSDALMLVLKKSLTGMVGNVILISSLMIIVLSILMWTLLRFKDKGGGLV